MLSAMASMSSSADPARVFATKSTARLRWMWEVLTSSRFDWELGSYAIVYIGALYGRGKVLLEKEIKKRKEEEERSRRKAKRQEPKACLGRFEKGGG